MSKPVRRAALAAVLKNLSSYTKPRWPKPGEKPHNTIELLSGAEFEGGDVVRDIGTYLSPTSTSGTSARTRRTASHA